VLTVVSASALLLTCFVTVSRSGVSLSSSTYDATLYGFDHTPGGGQNVTLSVTDNPPAGTYTYGIHLSTGASGGTPPQVKFSNSNVKVREYLK
jgi:hypothetical protein